ncbi:alpha/beta hydrolase [Rhizobium laguerreae]|uniref:alpha/beta hydrolase n=1 Tax=Rhizobium laguerreae TaxID=1076926 RepID=UPI001C8FB43C|nr:alpha/beta hydrolase [Rhizobium laguerreae]MBY3544957.1 alpha/beta hydrolase [Rhizobium laguerreae]MBY3551700.1 alpha/beta hydrolase [Rhizobium laguerreae]
MALARFDVEFTRGGHAFEQKQIDLLAARLPSVTDLIVLAHGWNNDMADARELYDGMVGNFEKLLQSLEQLPGLGGVGGRTYAICQVFWPSKKFTDKELIPGGGAASATKASDKALIELLENLKQDPIRLGGNETPTERVESIERAIKSVPNLHASALARKVFLNALRSTMSKKRKDAKEIDDGSAAFLEADPERIFKSMSIAVIAPGPQSSGGGVATLGAGHGGAAGVGDLVDGITAGARRIANFVTYYQMKERAGEVGTKGLAPLLKQCRKNNPALRIHLVGHSFGARVVTAAAAGLPKGTPGVTLSLLQAAFSHNALSGDYGKGKPGFYRTVLADARVSGPIIVTHTKNDKAVGVAYPLASRVAFQVAAALGDQNDPYGGLGRNGAQNTVEATGHDRILGKKGTKYAFTPGTVTNLLADEVIRDHNDVSSEAVAYAVLCCSGGI